MDGQNFRRSIAILALPVSLLLASCGSSAGTTSDGPAKADKAGKAGKATTSSTPNSDDVFPKGLRGVRYCEVLLLTKKGDRYQADVWNTLGLNDCPQAEWDELDAATIAKERGALVALLNGPRYWTLDSIISDIRAHAAETSFGSLEMFRPATVDLGTTLPSQTPFTERAVQRENTFRFKEGSEVYELTDPEGQVYVMQSYALIKDPTLTLDALPDLGAKLALPKGWTYSSRVLTEDLDVLSTKGVATVIQDDLQNTYQRIDAQEDE